MGTHPIFESDFDCLTERMSGVFSPRSEHDSVGDSTELSSRSMRRLRSPRTPRSTVEKTKFKLKTLSNWSSRRRADARGSDSYGQVVGANTAIDREQTERVRAALEKRSNFAALNASISEAQRAKMLPFPELLPEIEQNKFFHDEPLEADYEPRQAALNMENVVQEDTELGPVEFDQVLKLGGDVDAMTWGDRAQLEKETNIYVEPGEEAVLDESDNGALIRAANEANGIYMGDEVKLSHNLKAWLKRDKWLVNGIPYCLEEADVSDELEELRHHSVNLHEDYHRQVRRESPDLGPEPPTWNEEQMRDELIQQALQQRRNPNDPIRTIVMDSDGVALSPFEQITDSADRRRMEHIINSKYVVKLFYNGALVTQSDPLRITESLTIQDGRSYPIRTADRPKSVKLEIVESGGRFKSKSFGESILVLPGSDQTQPPLAERITKFPERQAVATASGGGGAVVTALHWGSDDKGFVLAPKNYKSEAIYDHRKPDMHDPELHLYSEGEDIITDQNDPAYQTRDNVDGEEATGYAGFVLNPFMTDGYFCPAEELEKSKRIRFLQLRAQEVSEFVGRTMVPLREHEILDSDFTTYESRIEQSYAETTVDDRRALVRIERQRTKEMVLQRLRAVSKTLSFNEVVVEDPVPEFGALLSNFSKFFEVRRPLRPERKAVKRRVKDQVKEPKIIASIRNAQNLPVRINKYDEEDRAAFQRDLFYGNGVNAPHARDRWNRSREPSRRTGKTVHTEQQDIDSYFECKQQSLKPFVSVSFLDNEERSSVAFGANPSWNEQIELSWATGLSRMLCGVPTLAREEFIFINIFDEDLLISNEGENVYTP